MKPQKSPSLRPVSPRTPARSLVDVALIGAGLASAAASVVFAVAMVARPDHAPLINGMQYLAIFSQPHPRGAAVAAAAPLALSAPAAAKRLASAAAAGPAARAQTGKAIDFDPTGSIFHLAADPPPQTDPYRLVAVEPGMAWLRNSVEMRVVKPGDVAPGLGRVAAIVNRDGRWALVDDSGAVLLAADRPQGAAIAEDPFSRSMIFGGAE